MHKYSSKIALSILTTIGLIGAAQASPVSYDFTATNFNSSFGYAPPATSLAGSFTLDGSTVTQIDLTIGSHSYTSSEVGFAPSSTNPILGATVNGVSGLNGGSNDFVLFGSTTPGGINFYAFSYSVASVPVSFLSYSGSITPAIEPPTVPLPAAGWLLGSGVLGLAGLARRRR